MIGHLVRHELRLRFLTPAWWLLASGIWLVCAWLLFAQLQVYQEIQPRLVASGANLGINELLVAPTLNVLAILLLVIAPLLGMASLAGERRSGRLALLLSTPLSLPQMLLGKWLGLLLPVSLIAAGILGMLSSLALGMQLDWARLATAMAGLILLSALASALSLACSAFTRQAAAAFAAALTVLIFLWLADGFVETGSPLHWFALSPHLGTFLQGTVTSDGLIYFTTLTLAALALAMVGLLRERESPPRRRLRELLAFLMLGILLAAAANLSQSQRHTLFRSAPLPEALLETLAAINGPITVTAWAPDYPILRARIEKLLRPLREIHPDFTLRWNDPQREPQLARETGITHDGELRIEAMGRAQRVPQPDHASLLRALRHLARRGEPWIVALQGNGEAPLGESQQGLGAWVRSLNSHGFRVVGVDAAGPIPDNAALLLAAAPAQDYAQDQVEKLKAFLRRGGRLLWLQEAGASSSLANLTGIGVLPGTLVTSAGSAGLSPLQLNVPIPVELDVPESGGAILDRAFALLPPEDGAWRIHARLQTGAHAWNETGPLQGELQRNPLQGERSGPHAVGLLIENGDNARIAVIGDSDLARNAQFGGAGNARLLLSVVNWLTDNRLDTRTAADDADIDWSPVVGISLALFHLLVGPALLGLAGMQIQRRRSRA